MSNGFTKLFSSIITSSLWVEPDPVLRVWIAMLATCNASGKVEGGIPGFASLCRISVEEMEKCEAKLLSPDKHSRTKTAEGRRIERVDGGWQIINYLAYRQKGQEKDGSRAEYFRKYRKCSTQQSNVACNTEAEAEAEAEVHTHPPTPQVQPKTTSSGNGVCVNVKELIPDKRVPENWGGTEKTSSEAMELMQLLGGLYHREPADPWTYEEQHLAVSITLRGNWKKEWSEIHRYRTMLREKRWFPQSILSLLTKWTETLDKSRGAKRNPSMVGH